MRVVVFGSTGKTGRAVVLEAVRAGLTVTAVTRRPAPALAEAGARIVQADLSSATDLARALDGQDAVVSALGPRDYDVPDTLVSDFVAAVTPPALDAGCKRIVVVSGAGLLQADDTTLVCELPSYPPMFRHVNADSLRALELLRGGGLPWTVLCCPRIVDGAADGAYAVARQRVPPGTRRDIQTGNIARFVAEELRAGAYVGTRVGIAAVPAS